MSKYILIDKNSKDIDTFEIEGGEGLFLIQVAEKGLGSGLLNKTKKDLVKILEDMTFRSTLESFVLFERLDNNREDKKNEKIRNWPLEG